MGNWFGWFAPPIIPEPLLCSDHFLLAVELCSRQLAFVVLVLSIILFGAVCFLAGRQTRGAGLELKVGVTKSRFADGAARTNRGTVVPRPPPGRR